MCGSLGLGHRQRAQGALRGEGMQESREPSSEHARRKEKLLDRVAHGGLDECAARRWTQKPQSSTAVDQQAPGPQLMEQRATYRGQDRLEQIARAPWRSAEVVGLLVLEQPRLDVVKLNVERPVVLERRAAGEPGRPERLGRLRGGRCSERDEPPISGARQRGSCSY